MGLDLTSARLLKQENIWSGASVLTVGRQNWWLTPREARSIGSNHRPPYGRANYSEPFFRELGATVVESIDLVPFEKPTHIADLSKYGSTSTHWERFDVTVDLGTAEHVADQNVYWANLHFTLRPGGHLVGALPADHLCGHGLYQYSPEFFHRMGGFTPVRIGWVVYSPIVRFIPFTDDGRHQRGFRWPTYVWFHLQKKGPFTLPTQYQNATTPTGKQMSASLAGKILSIPGVRFLERLLR